MEQNEKRDTLCESSHWEKGITAAPFLLCSQNWKDAQK